MSRRPYVRPFRNSWWLAHPRYIKYMARELTSVLIAAYTIVVLLGIARLAEGEAAYHGFLAAMYHPAAIFFHCLALVCALYHTITWFGVTPKAMPLRLGERKVPGQAIIGAHYAALLVVSGVVLWLVMGG